MKRTWFILFVAPRLLLSSSFHRFRLRVAAPSGGYDFFLEMKLSMEHVGRYFREERFTIVFLKGMIYDVMTSKLALSYF